MRAVIFVNGYIDDYDWLRDMLKPDDHLIGADGGAQHCLAVGRLPDVVVGDMDSLAAETLDELVQQGVEVEWHPRSKDATDLELAIVRAVHEGADEVVLVGALGGRLDQTFANMLVSAHAEWPVPILLTNGNQTARVLRGHGRFAIDAPVGSTVSVVPLSQQVTGICYTGLEYPLENATLELGTTRGISNVVKETPACIEIEDGLLLVVYAASARSTETGGRYGPDG